jgi:hypothetical protein
MCRMKRMSMVFTALMILLTVICTGHAVDLTDEQMFQELWKYISGSPRTAAPDHFEQLYVECKDLYNTGQYAQLLDLAEVQLTQGWLDSTTYTSSVQAITKYMAQSYKQTGQIERGVDYLLALYMKDADHPMASELGSRVFDLSLEAGLYHTAKLVLDHLVECDPYPGYWIEFYTRFYATTGDYPTALNTLAEGFTLGISMSRTRAISLPYLAPLHADPAFQQLVTETPETWAAFLRPSPTPYDLASESITLQELTILCDFFKSITDAPTAAEKWQETYRVFEQVYPHAERYKEELWQLFINEPNALFYQISLGMILLALADDALTTQVVESIDEKELERFPYELYRLAFLAARSTPHAAPPLIARLLKLSPDSLPSTGYIDLYLACGIAEPAVIDLLLSAAQSDNETESRNALRVLHFLAEPRLVPILQDKMAATTDTDAWEEYLSALAFLDIPEAWEAFNAVDSADLPPSVKDRLAELRKNMRQPSGLVNDTTLVISNPTLKNILFSNLAITQGYHLSDVVDILAASATPDDIEQLKRIRRSILRRGSDEALHDYMEINSVINHIRWQQYQTAR